MSLRKILFLAGIGSLLLFLIIAMMLFSNKKQTTQNLSGKLIVWILGDTTEGYQSLVDGFYAMNPTYKSITIEFRKFSDYPTYEKLVLSTLADGTGPDIFMIRAGEETLLKNQIDPLPSDIVDFTDFEKRYDDTFLSLLSSTGSEGKLKNYLQGVPLGYETLGVFYNKSLLISAPKTWNEYGNLYSDGIRSDIFPVGIGLDKRYTPYAGDIVALFLAQEKGTGVHNIVGDTGLDLYTSFGNTHLQNKTETEVVQGQNLIDLMSTYNKKTVLDAFMEGKIASVIGYQSLIKDIEDAKKRAGENSANGLILTEQLPQMQLNTTKVNIIRYNYLVLSKNSKNSIAGAKFLEYLLTDDAEAKFLKSFSYYIPAQIGFYEASRNISLSSVFPKAKLDSFIPETGMKLVDFYFYSRLDFDKILSESFDKNNIFNKNDFMKSISELGKCDEDCIK